MFYAWDINIPANRSSNDPVRQVLDIAVGVVTRVSIKFARGCHGQVKTRLEWDKFQFFPLSAGEWVTGDNEAVTSEEYFEIKTDPAKVVFLGCSPGTSYEHDVTVRITVLPKKLASMIPIINLLTRLLQRMGVFR